MDFEPGATIGRYRLIRKLGEGGMGCVFEAEHVELHKRVAIKLLSSSLAKSAGARARFEREAQAAARLDHPHAVAVIDVGVDKDVPFFVMEHLEGEDLEATFEREGRLSIERTLEIALPVAAALAAAHSAGIVHRDIKPQNVFLARNKLGGEVPKLLDFGISKVTDSAAENLTATASMLGTPVYMSPEQVQAAKHADARSDQYSLAVLIYQAVAGRLPFEASELYPLLSEIATGRHTPLSDTCPEAPVEFRATIARAMSLDRNQRFASVTEFAQALLPFAGARARALWEPIFGSAERASVPPSTEPMIAAPAHLARPGNGPNTVAAIASTIDTARSNLWRWLLLGGALLGSGLFYYAVARQSSSGEQPSVFAGAEARPVPSAQALSAAPSSSVVSGEASPKSEAPAKSAPAKSAAPPATEASVRPRAPAPRVGVVTPPRVVASEPIGKRPAPAPPPRAPLPTPPKTRNNSPILE